MNTLFIDSQINLCKKNFDSYKSIEKLLYLIAIGLKTKNIGYMNDNFFVMSGAVHIKDSKTSLSYINLKPASYVPSQDVRLISVYKETSEYELNILNVYLSTETLLNELCDALKKKQIIYFDYALYNNIEIPGKKKICSYKKNDYGLSFLRNLRNKIQDHNIWYEYEYKYEYDVKNIKIEDIYSKINIKRDNIELINISLGYYNMNKYYTLLCLYTKCNNNNIINKIYSYLIEDLPKKPNKKKKLIMIKINNDKNNILRICEYYKNFTVMIKKITSTIFDKFNNICNPYIIDISDLLKIFHIYNMQLIDN